MPHIINNCINIKELRLLDKLPQTLLFGNGINYGIGKSWEELLIKLKKGHLFDDDTLPNTMTYEQILLKRLPNTSNNIINEEYNIKSEVAEHMSNLEVPPIYKDLINLNFQHYLTTNYDNIFIEAYEKMYLNNITVNHKSTETIYSIRRYKQLNNCKLWNIHGEINQPRSIMLGMDQYIGSVSKIDDYIKGKYKFSNTNIKDKIENKIQFNKYDNISWIELFFNSDIHILGFGLDYSEIDLWWILNKRSRLMNKLDITNKIFFYVKALSSNNTIEVPNNVKEYNEKVELLKSFNVIVKPLECDYNELYQKAISEIKKYNNSIEKL